MPKGVAVETFGPSGTFFIPSGIAVDRHENFYVPDAARGRAGGLVSLRRQPSINKAQGKLSCITTSKMAKAWLTTGQTSRSRGKSPADLDGDLDVLSAAYSDNKIAWYENNFK